MSKQNTQEPMKLIAMRIREDQLDRIQQFSQAGDGYTGKIRDIIDGFLVAMMEAGNDVQNVLKDEEILFLCDMLKPGRYPDVDFFNPHILPNTLLWGAKRFFDDSPSWKSRFPWLESIRETLEKLSVIESLSVVYLAARFWGLKDKAVAASVNPNDEAVRIFRTVDL